MSEHYLKEELSQLAGNSTIFEFLQQGSLDGLWYLDIENPLQEWMSPEFKRLFGYEDHEIPNTSVWWQANIHPDDLQVAIDNYVKHLEDPSFAYDQVVRYRHKDGSIVWVRCRGIAIRDETGKPIRMLGAHTDLTAQKQTAAALERRNDALKHFAQAAGHDLRSPLRHIMLSLQFMREDSPEEIAGVQLEHLENAEKAGLRLQVMLEGILDLAETEGSDMPIAPVDLAEVAKDAVANLSQDIVARGATVEIGDLPRVAGNASALLRALQNLVSNVLQHAVVEDLRIDLIAEKVNASSWEVRVQDNGVGIPAELREKALQPFGRLVGKAVPGAGLGLSLCTDVVNRLGGTLRIEETTGGGTTFVMTLNAAESLE